MSVTLKDLARETGLSVATISKYINGVKLRDCNRIAIEKAVKKLGYTVNEYARGLKSNKSRTIGVIIPELSNLFVTQIITTMENVLRRHGYSVIICDCHTDEALECESVNFLLSKMVDGIINMPVCSDGRHLKPAIEKGVPVLLLDRTIPELKNIANCVLIDNEGAAESAVSYLIERGHKNIGIIVGPRGIFTSQNRLKGYKTAFKKNNCDTKNEFIRYSDYSVEGGYESMTSLLKEKPEITAVFVTNYEMTLGAIIAINESNIKVPEQLSIIGFDNMDLSRIYKPHLTIVTQPLEEIGTQAANIMLDRLSEKYTSIPLTLSLSASILHGESVAVIR